MRPPEDLIEGVIALFGITGCSYCQNSNTGETVKFEKREHSPEQIEPTCYTVHFSSLCTFSKCVREQYIF